MKDFNVIQNKITINELKLILILEEFCTLVFLNAVNDCKS